MVMLHKEIEENIYRNTFKWLLETCVGYQYAPPPKKISQTEFALTLEKLPMLHSENTFL